MFHAVDTLRDPGYLHLPLLEKSKNNRRDRRLNKLKNLRVELKNDYEKTEFTIYEMDRENDRFIVHFQFSILNFRLFRAACKFG